MISVEDYAAFLDREYLADYVADGGAAVKFLVAADDNEARAVSEAVLGRSRAAGYQTAAVDAATVRIHMIDQVFFEVARQVDWDALAAHAVRGAWAAIAHPAPDDGLTAEAVAAHHGVDAGELTRDVNRELQRRIYRDYAMVQEFRIAMLRLCQAQIASCQVTDAEHTAVLDWLRGDLRRITLLRSALIFRRIGRHNARQLLFSLAHWLSANQRVGLVLELDIRRLAVARRPPPEERQGAYYTKAGLLDAYELLRQLVDNTDEAAHCCVVVVAAPEFLTDTNRGLDAYQALKLRIFDEVRDVRRDNPYSSLIRLGVAS